MNARFATADEIADWDNLVENNPDGGEFFQSLEFAEVKQTFGWEPVYLALDKVYVLALQKRVVGLGKLWYLQKGPGLPTAKSLVAALPDLKQLAHDNGVFSIKFEPQLLQNDANEQALKDAGVIPSSAVQPTFSTIWLDISGELDDIVAGFNGKARYNIRQAEKAGVVCREVEATNENCRAFYELFRETADGRFGIRPYAYYKKFWQTFCEHGHGKLLFAYHDDQLVSADFIMIFGAKASRKDAASPRQKTIRGAAALLEVEAIKILKKLDVEHYDLCGTPPASEIKNQAHPLYGIGQFKAGFSDKVTDYIGSFQIPVSPRKARLWTRFVEKAVRRASYRLYHQSYY